MTVDPDEIRFELERLSVSEPGRLDLAGRWFGIRGRRFVRPTLLLTLDRDDVEQRLLADLEHKPWAAQDGDLWTAAFPVDDDVEPEAAASIKLTVAPDITITLKRRRGARRRPIPEQRPAAPAAGSEDSTAPRSEKVGERERVRRKELVGDRDRAMGERDHALTMRDEAAAERDRATAEGRQATDQRDQAIADRDQAIAERDEATAERDRALRATARADRSLRDREAALQTAIEELAGERAESGRLRAQLTRAQAHDERGGEGRTGPVEAPALARRTESRARVEPPHSDRPLNPSLRSRANWFVRILTVLVIMGVIVAILDVVRMTIAPH